MNTISALSQHLNGAAVLVNGIFIAWALVYLWRSARQRKMTTVEILRRPPAPMVFTFAVLIFDSGVWIRSVMTWAWRRYYQSGSFENYQIVIFEIGAMLIVTGSLAKLWAVTQPEWGALPWLICVALVTALFFLL